MAKKGIKTALFAAASAVAATLYLKSESGQKTKKKVVKFAKEYKENPAAKHEALIQKSKETGQKAVEKFQDVKDQVAAGEFTVETTAVTEKAAALKEQSAEKIEQIKEKMAEKQITTKGLLASIKEKFSRKQPAAPLALPETAEVIEEEPEEAAEVITIDLTEEAE